MLFSPTLFTSLALLLESSVAKQIPPSHILWGEGGKPQKALPSDATTAGPGQNKTLEERDSVCTNGPLTRNCWSNGFSVATDFDAKWPTTGRTVSVNFEITNTTCNPDGHGSQQCLLVNGQYPGPTIIANWGDTLSVTVKNSMQDNGTGIHWHGIRQLQSNGMDGTGGITECPLAPGKTKTYTFQCTQTGTTWYHSHYSSQYGMGVFGGLIINGPATANYDIDLGTYIVNDWYYQTAYQIEAEANANLQAGSGPPPANNIIVNGTNKNANGGGSYGKVTIQSGKKYLLRLINTSSDNAIRVTLDNHTFQVITSDLVPIHPYNANWVLLGIGQRYDVVFTANQTVGNYWFRAQAEASCASANQGSGQSIFSYAGAAAGNPSSTAATKPSNCNDEGPLVPWVVNNVPSDTFTSQAKSLNVDIEFPGTTTNNQNIVVWGVNLTAIDVNWEKPTLSYVAQGDTNYPVVSNLIELPTENIWTYWIIQETPGTVAPIPHPIHLHGHDFYVLGTGSGTFSNSSISTLNFNNPTRRDVAMLPGGGWLVIAFPTDNPGAWLMHCHISWHISEGLGVQFLESKSTIPALPADYNNVCSSWATYYNNTAAYKQSDSGLRI